jgi:hypothetical protein
MDYPEIDKEVLVQLDNNHFAVAKYDGETWLAGNGVYASHEMGNDLLSGRVVGWQDLPETQPALDIKRTVSSRSLR